MAGRDDNPYRRLPERPRPEDLRATHDPEPVHDEPDDAFRENQWFLRTSGA